MQTALFALLAALAFSSGVIAQEQRYRKTFPNPDTAALERRFALVIGNRAYPQGGLITPENDANDMAAVLRRLGFEVVIATNLDPTKFKAAIRRFEDALATSEGKTVALFYFAGHGVQIQGKNYLLPAHVEYKDQRDIIDNGIDADQLLSRVQSQDPELTIMILDACRDSPLPAVVRSAKGSGLARMNPPAGTFLAFATSPGSTASDNHRERNGLFTKYVLQHLQTPGLTAEHVFRRVRTDVYRASRGTQLPEDTNRLVGGDFYFVPPEKRMDPRITEIQPTDHPVVIGSISAPPVIASQEVLSGASRLLADALSPGRSIAYDVEVGGATLKLIAERAEGGVRLSDGSFVTDKRISESHCCIFDPPIPYMALPLDVGTTWNYSGQTSTKGSLVWAAVTAKGRIMGKERLETKIGPIDAIRISEERWSGSLRSDHERWVEPETFILLKEMVRTPTGPVLVTIRELLQ